MQPRPTNHKPIERLQLHECAFSDRKAAASYLKRCVVGKVQLEPLSDPGVAIVKALLKNPACSG